MKLVSLLHLLCRLWPCIYPITALPTPCLCLRALKEILQVTWRLCQRTLYCGSVLFCFCDSHVSSSTKVASVLLNWIKMWGKKLHSLDFKSSYIYIKIYINYLHLHKIYSNYYISEIIFYFMF